MYAVYVTNVNHFDAVDCHNMKSYIDAIIMIDMYLTESVYIFHKKTLYMYLIDIIWNRIDFITHIHTHTHTVAHCTNTQT